MKTKIPSTSIPYSAASGRNFQGMPQKAAKPVVFKPAVAKVRPAPVSVITPATAKVRPAPVTTGFGTIGEVRPKLVKRGVADPRGADPRTKYIKNPV